MKCLMALVLIVNDLTFGVIIRLFKVEQNSYPIQNTNGNNSIIGEHIVCYAMSTRKLCCLLTVPCWLLVTFFQKLAKLNYEFVI